MTAAEATVNQGGVIIMLASSSDGIGGDHFYHQLADKENINKTMDIFLGSKRNETVPDQWHLDYTVFIKNKTPLRINILTVFLY